jgi:hypothetical protein
MRSRRPADDPEKLRTFPERDPILSEQIAL